MASADDASSLTQDKLPSISVAENLELIGAASTDRRNPCDRASTWALSIRQRLNSRIQGYRKPDGPDIDLLVAELIITFITVIKTNRKSSWRYLYEVLLLTAQYRNYLRGKPQLLRHLESVYYHYEINRAKLAEIDILGAMGKAFPRDTSPLYEKNRKPGRTHIDTRPRLPPLPEEPLSNALLPHIATRRGPFLLEQGLQDIQDQKLLSFSDLHQSVAIIGASTAQLEAAWQSKLGLMAKAFRVNLTGDYKHKSTQTETADNKTERESPSSVLMKDLSEPTSVERSVSEPLSGEDAVAILAKCSHLGKTKFYYLNIKPSPVFRPYDLIVVPKHKMDPEHYVFSTFGVLAISPGLGSEVMSLGDWQREAMLWRALTHIPFFKNYFLRRAFALWYRNMKREWMLKRRNVLWSRLLPAIPHFGAALLQISRLLQELQQVHWLPVQVTESQTVDGLMQLHDRRVAEASNLLEKFFNYCNFILQLVREDSYKMIQDCVAQLELIIGNFVKEPVHVQRVHQEVAEKQLQEARQVTQNLGRLGALVSHMMMQNLITLAQDQVSNFVRDVLQTTNISRPAFLVVTWNFDAEGHMIMVPSRQELFTKMSEMLKSVGENIIRVLESVQKVDPSQPAPGLEDQVDGQTRRKPDSPGGKPSQTVCKACGTGRVTGERLDAAGFRNTGGELSDYPKSKISEPSCTISQPWVLLGQRDNDALRVNGQQLKAHFTQLPTSLLRSEILEDRRLQAAQRKQKLIFKAAAKEIIMFRTRHLWLSEANQMVNMWSLDEMEKLRGWKPQQYQNHILQLKKWLGRLKGMDRLFVTRNQTLVLDCIAIQEKMVPLLKSMKLDVLSFLKLECENRSRELITDLTEAIKQMQEKPTGYVAFAFYLSKLELYNRTTPDLQQRMDYAISLIQIVRLQFLQHSSFGDKEEEQAEYLWNTFLEMCKEALEFTVIHKDSIIDNLEHIFRLLASEVQIIDSTLISEPFLDPLQNGTVILQLLFQLRIKCISLTSSLEELSQSRSTIKGEPFDLSFLAVTEKNINSRQETWNLFYSISQDYKDWKNTLYKMLDLNEVDVMLDQWLSMLEQLRRSVPADDRILLAIEQMLLQLQEVLPILKNLRSPGMEERHWKAIFTEMGETWNPEWEMTLADLLAYDLPSYSDFIAQILTTAQKEFELQVLLKSVETFWQNCEFKFVTHIAVVRYQKPNPDRSQRRQGGKLHQPEQEWAAKNSGTLTLIEMERLRWHTEDSLMTLSMLVATSMAGNIQKEAEKLMEMIQHFERVNLTPPLEAAPSSIPWLRGLELRIQQTLFHSLERCITERKALTGEINSQIIVEPSSRSDAYKAAQLMKPILKLVSSFPVQCIQIAEEVCWLSDIENVLFRRSSSKEWFKTLYSTKIDRLVMCVRGLCKESVQRSEDPHTLFLLKCLVLMSINHRDIGDNLMASNIESKTSFEWHKFIKYQFHLNWIFPKRESSKPLANQFGHSMPGGDQSQFGLRCYVNLLGNNYYYDYEYVSPKQLYVQTPMTERMCLALLLALQNFNPCALVGSCGTGKTSTIYHLAKVLGYQLVIFHCCKDMNLAFITRVLSGAIQSGAWLILENIDSLTPGALSILGQHLTTVQNSYRALTTKDHFNTSYKDHSAGPYRKELGTNLIDVIESGNLNNNSRCTWSCEDLRRFDPTALGSVVFAGNVISARVSYGAFVTLHRFDSSVLIPENLRLVLRPVSVIQPDVKVIIEVKLLSIGFLKASHLSGKILSFFQVAKDLGSITDCCQLPLIEKALNTAAKILYQTLQPIKKDSELRSNGRSNPSQSQPTQAQNEQKGDRGNSDTSGTTTNTGTGEQCLSVSHQQVLNTRSTTAAYEISELSEDSRNIPASVLESELSIEEHSVLKALAMILFPTVSDDDKLFSLKGLLRDMFPESCMTHAYLDSDPHLLSVIEQELLETDHQVTKQTVKNILSLYQALKVSKGVIMYGYSGSGKTTSYRTLSRTMNLLAKNESQETGDESDYPSPTHRTVQVSVCFPNSLSIEELLGVMDNQTWKNGIVAKWLSGVQSWSQARAVVKEFKSPEVKSYCCPEPLRWIVLDGELCLDWLGPISGLVSQSQSLTLSNGEQIRLAESTSLILEVTDLSNAPPSAVTWCNLVHFQGSEMWKAVLDRMMNKIYSNYTVPRDMVQVWTRLGQDLIPNTLTFVEKHCISALHYQADYAMVKQNKVAHGLQEVMTFRNILHALLDKHLARDQQGEDEVGVDQKNPSPLNQRGRLDDSIRPMDHMLARSILAVAYIWAFGGHLHLSSWPQFDQFARQALGSSDYNIHIPADGLVFDYYLNPATGNLENLHKDSEPRKIKSQNYILTPELEKYVKLLDLLLSSGYSTLLVGEQLSGKTSFVQALKGLISISTMCRLPLSPNSRPNHTRSYVTDKIFFSKQPELSLPSAVTASGKNKVLFFLDDIHAAPFKPGYGCQAIIEIFRHSITCHGSYDQNCQQFRYFHSTSVNYIGTCAPFRGRASFISSRFTRLFSTLTLPEMTSAMLISIYSPSVIQWLNSFPTYTLARHALLAKALVSATVELYQRVRQQLRPSPSRSYYLFSMMDVGKVLNGLLLMYPICITTLVKPNKKKFKHSGTHISPVILSVTKIIVDLWLHESMRTFSDCLLTKEDKMTLIQILEGVAQINFCTLSSDATGKSQPLYKIAETSSVPEYQQDNMQTSLKWHSADERGEISHDKHEEIEESINLDPQIQLSNSRQIREFGFKTSDESEDQGGTTERDSIYSKSDILLVTDSESLTSGGARDLSESEAPKSNFYPSPPQQRVASGQKRHKRVRGRGKKTKRSEILKPLLPPHLLRQGDSLTDLIYSKGAVRPSNKQQMDSPRWNPYQKISNDDLAQQLKLIVQKLNQKNKTNRQIIFFTESVCHFVRIYRILCSPRSHCVLLALAHYTGRKTLVRLAAYLTLAKVFELSSEMSSVEMAKMIKQASYEAGIQGANIVIMAHGTLRKDTFHDLSDLITEGKYPELYTASELEELAKVFTSIKRLPWNVNREQALERFLLAVLQSLHVVLLMEAGDRNYPLEHPSGLPKHLASFLLHCSYIDVWQPWSHQAYIQIATSHLGVSNLSTLNRTGGQAIAQIWQMIPEITKVMALIHQSALNYADHVAPTLPLISPRHFLDFIDLFWMISYTLDQTLGLENDRTGQGLDKVQDVYKEAEEFRKHIDQLKHKLDHLAKIRNQLLSRYGKAKAEFLDLLSQCRDEEFRITLLMRELEAAHKKFEKEFGTVKPIFATAMKALHSLSSVDLDEVRTYRAPPPPVVMVMNTLCLMFGKPDGWDNVKQLISQSNFYQVITNFNHQYCFEPKHFPVSIVLNAISNRLTTLYLSFSSVSYDYSLTKLLGYRTKFLMFSYSCNYRSFSEVSESILAEKEKAFQSTIDNLAERENLYQVNESRPPPYNTVLPLANTREQERLRATTLSLRLRFKSPIVHRCEHDENPEKTMFLLFAIFPHFEVGLEMDGAPSEDTSNRLICSRNDDRQLEGFPLLCSWIDSGLPQLRKRRLSNCGGLGWCRMCKKHPGRLLKTSVNSTNRERAILDLVLGMSQARSQSGLQELFLKEVLYFERHRGADVAQTKQMDIQYLQHQLHVEQEDLMDKVIQTATSLLADNTIQAAALKSQEVKEKIHGHLSILSADGKNVSAVTEDPFVIISKVGSEMYWALIHISRLNPLYYFSKTYFMKVVRHVLARRNLKVRPSGSGTSTDHFVHLLNYLISNIYNYFRWCLFVKHARLYRFLVVVGYMKLMNTVTQVEWELFLRGIHELNCHALRKDSCVLRPVWVSEEIWNSCAILELLPAFRNIRFSLIKQTNQWREYFGLSSTVISAAPSCAFSHLTIFQKAILWRLFRPEKLSVIMNDIVSCELGGTLIRDLRFTHTSLFNYSLQNTFIMFLIPADSVTLSTHPIYWIEQMAREHQMQNNVHIICLGSNNQTAMILHELRKAMSRGKWLVLNNCHLLEYWDTHLVTLLLQIINAQRGYIPSKAAAPNVSSEHYQCNILEEDQLTDVTEAGDKIHPDFHLWMICDSSACGSLPGILRRCMTKLVIETPSMLQNTLRRSYSQAQIKLGDTVKAERLALLAVLHSILLHRQHYRSWVQAHPYHWTQADLFAALDIQVKLQTTWADSESLLELLIGGAVYHGHVLDRGDEAALSSVINHCLTNSQPFSFKGIRSFVTSLTSSRGASLVNLTQQDIEKRIDHLPNSIESITIGICNGFEKKMFEQHSEFISKILLKSQMLYIPLQVDSSHDGSLTVFVGECIRTLEQLRDSGSEIPQDPATEAKWLSAAPMKSFLQQERRDFDLLIKHLLCDLNHTLHVLEGCRHRNPETDIIIECLQSGCLPPSWQLLTSVSPPFPRWMQILKMRLQLLNNYLDNPGSAVSYNLAVFQQPRMFLVTLLQQKAQMEHLSLNQYRIHAQVLSSVIPPSRAPVNGIYITGLQLRNALWDTRQSLLQDTLSIKPCSMPTVWLWAEAGEAEGTQSPHLPYQCPIYLGTESMDVDLKDSNIITHIPLESRMDHLVCTQRRVHIVSII
ncbi:dynein heavy chain domain-containing protein 1-like [Scyliorhinus canicula]|uniref:dynein heavy chain domain-containing protein 1-like n=1 Tax=Scyliorhinus canicula TaxID=7830 RepID=UPI0018F57143|nr:dynein heavy chain domain-containing protein 1-like [Scyliorhinus canicula]